MKPLKKLLDVSLNPQCLRGIGIFLGFSKEAKWHRQLALKIHPNLSRFQWFAILAIVVIIWYVAIVWIQLSYALLIAKKRQQLNATTIPSFLYLALILGASPYNYFALNLKPQHRQDWCKYIFLEEQLTWYGIFNRDSTTTALFEQDISRLSDKQAFSEFLLNHQLPSIPTLAEFSPVYSNKIETLEQSIDKLIEQNTHFFIKPRYGNAMRGCLWVNVDPQSSECYASGFSMNHTPVNLNDKNALIDHIVDSLSYIKKDKKDKNSLLVQKYFESCPEIKQALNTSASISIRLITIRDYQKIKTPDLQYAFFEENSASTEKIQWKAHNIDIQQGNINGYPIPGWPSIIESAIAAHSLFPSMRSIAWDAIITDDGLKMLEGNYGWDIIAAQRVSRTPALIYLQD